MRVIGQPTYRTTPRGKRIVIFTLKDSATGDRKEWNVEFSRTDNVAFCLACDTRRCTHAQFVMDHFGQPAPTISVPAHSAHKEARRL